MEIKDYFWPSLLFMLWIIAPFIIVLAGHEVADWFHRRRGYSVVAWVARQPDLGLMWAFDNKPIRFNDRWHRDVNQPRPGFMHPAEILAEFPELAGPEWKDEPRRVVIRVEVLR